ncbi:MAG: ATP-binding protein [Acidobacteriota bacterium]
MNTKEADLNDILARLARSTAMSEGKQREALKVITETAAKALEVDRVNVWLFDSSRTKISCIEAYQASNHQHTLGEKLLAKDYPIYFEALRNLRVINVIDAFKDDRTRELKETYLKQHQVTTMLDAPIYIAGEMTGVVCHEHIGRTRDWTREEMSFAGSIADLVSLTLETDRRIQAEQQALVLQAKMLESHRLESLGLLASGVAHDFNNLLLTISTNAELIKRNLFDAVKIQSYIADIALASERASELCNQLLTFSGKAEIHLGSVNLTEVVFETIRLLKVSIPKNIKIETRLDRQIPVVNADAIQIRQIVLNLLTNASEAIGENPGTIRIQTGTAYFDKEILDDAYHNGKIDSGKYVFLEVADSGCGMNSETQKLMLEPFFTTKPTGRGLGMAVTLGIIRKHNGAIKISSDVGKGATIRVLLPLS